MNASPVLESPAATAARPLVVDLDGTLVRTDLLLETANAFIVNHPWRMWRLLPWLAQGRAALKGHLAQAEPIDVAALPYNEDVLAWLREEKAQGRTLVLATASHRHLADAVARHLQLFDDVIATEGGANLKSAAKRDALVARYGEKGFDYAGDHAADLCIWQAADKAHVVGASPALVEQALSQGNVASTVQGGKPFALAALLQAMRPHQWLKNLLVFIPLLAAHKYGDGPSVGLALVAFVAFGFAASSVYLLNDLVDVQDDRHHARKRERPFASGDLSLLLGWIAWPVLLAAAFALSLSTLPMAFTASLALYAVITVAYSLRLKQVPVVDVLTLAALYTLRIIAGAAAIAVPLSFWLLSFSMFIFVSLAFIKRFSELKAARDAGGALSLRGRGYAPQDLELIASLGTGSGLVAVLVLALYIQDGHTAAMYAQPRFIWLACPLLLYWVARAWLIAHRGRMHDDPIVFALKDRVSWLVAGLMAGVFVLAKVAA